MRRWIVPALVALVLAAALAWGFWPRPLPVDLGTVGRGALAVSIGEEGETRVRDVFVVSAPVPGRVMRIAAEPGDPVAAGRTVLAEIRPADPAFNDARTRQEREAALKAAEAALGQAQADLQRIEAEAEFARAEFQRARSLSERGTISQSALDRAAMQLRTQEAAVKTARATVQVRHFELETARAALIGPSPAESATASCCFPILAPVDGRVLRVFRESEGVVDAGTPLLELGDPRDLEIVVDLLSSDAVRVESGAAVEIERWGGDSVLNGRVRLVEPFGFTKVSALGIEEQRVNVLIDLVDPPEAWARLGHGFRVEARIVLWRGEALRAPLAALFRDGDAWAAFAVEDGRARLRHLTLGRMNDEAAEVLGGLGEGDRVVLYPGDRVEDGVPVEAREAGG